MTEYFNGLLAVLGVFAQSDAYGPPPPMWYIMLTGQAAHFLLGAAFAYVKARHSVVTVIAVAWIAKEVLGDIRNSGGAGIVWLDSMFDLGFGFIGFWVARQKGMTPDET